MKAVIITLLAWVCYAQTNVIQDAQGNVHIPGVMNSAAAAYGPNTIGSGPAQIPLATISTRQIREVSDGSSATDCTVGGGSTLVVCWSNGVIWQAFGTSSSISTVGLRILVFVFDGGGSALSTGKTQYLSVPFACTISGWSIGSTTAETVTVKTWKIVSGTALPTVSNSISTSGVSLSTGTAVQSTTLSDFTTTAVAANNWVAANLTAVTASQYVVFQLGCQQ